jgi:hypothetical protein
MADTNARARREAGDLSAMLLPELRKTATNLGIDGAADMKKPDLVKAISDLQAANREAARAEREARRAARMQRRKNSDEDEEMKDDQPNPLRTAKIAAIEIGVEIATAAGIVIATEAESEIAKSFYPKMMF